MSGFIFKDSAFLLLLPVIILPIIWHFMQSRRQVKLSGKQVLPMAHARRHWRLFAILPTFLRVLAISACVLALARPQFGEVKSQRQSEGLDIMLVVDTSGSMRAVDFSWNGERMTRLDVLIQVLGNFIEKRRDDRLGMVVFGTDAFIQSPMTLDHEVLGFFLQGLQIGMAGEKTAIGDALATAVSRLKDLQSKSRIVILLTDGDNTAGKIEPLAAAEAAKAFDVKVYTIGLGSGGNVPVPIGGGMYNRVQIPIDEKSLQEIAQLTGGKYFKAETTQDLLQVYETIDQLEKTEAEMDVYEQYEEHYPPFVWAAAFLLIFEVLFSLTRFRKIP